MKLQSEVFRKNETISAVEWQDEGQREVHKWLWSFQTIRDKIFDKAKVDKLHINEKEAKRYLNRFENK